MICGFQFDFDIVGAVSNVMTNFVAGTIFQEAVIVVQEAYFIFMTLKRNINFAKIFLSIQLCASHIDKVAVGYSSDVAEVTFETSQVLY